MCVPIAFFIAAMTFLVSIVSVFRGAAAGLRELEECEQPAPEIDPETMWDRHIARMQEKQNKNNTEP